jgi:hypothetical protein
LASLLWLPKEGADRLARYPEKERGEIITRALVLLESQGGLTGESRGEDEGEALEDTLTVAELSTRLKRVEAILSTIISNSTGVLTGDEPPGPPATPIGESTDKPRGEVAVALSETPAKLPPKRVAALSRRAKKLSAQGVSWKAIARQWNDEGIPTRSGIGKWHGSTVAKLVGTE